MKKILSRISIGSAAAITLAAGLTSVVGATTYYNDEGPKDHHKSSQTVLWESSFDGTTLANIAMFGLHNETSQTTATGDVDIEAEDDRTKVTVGNVTTGDAMNANATSATVAVDNRSSNSAALAGGSEQSPLNGGQYVSKNTSTFSNSVTTAAAMNMTDLSICNSTEQEAYSGDVKIEAEDDDSKVTVGNVTTGDATNTNSTSIVFTVAN